MAKITRAEYSPQRIKAFQGNPLIEALPALRSQKEIAAMLSVLPDYSALERSYTAQERQLLTQQILRFHVPGEQDILIYQTFSSCIRWGYSGRNPLSPTHTHLINATSGSGNAQAIQAQYFPNTYGFLIYGVSGIGKTCTVENILYRFPQVIIHNEYNGHALPHRQVVWLKIDTPPDGSLKSLCLSFFRGLDQLLGTCYESDNRRHTLDVMLSSMKHAACTENLGILVIDEAQHLCTAKATVSETALNFYVSLVNTIGLPVVLIGTPKVCPLINRDFQQAKRASGQGNIYWTRMDNDGTWKRFVRSMWHFQYTATEIPLSDQMADAVYNECFGIPFLATQIYRLVQMEAISDGSEVFDCKSFRKAADKYLRLSNDMRKSLREGKEVDIRAILGDDPADIWPGRNRFIIRNDDPLPELAVSTEQSILEKVSCTLAGLGLTAKEAITYAVLSCEKQKGAKDPAVIARAAWELYLQSKSASSPSSPMQTEIPIGYNGAVDTGLIEEAL